MMLKELMYKWFNLEPRHCETCEVLRSMLDESNRERKELLHQLIHKDKIEPPSTQTEEYKPLTPQFVPWRVRQQMLEAEDRKKAHLMQEKAKEIAELEKELDVVHE
jgi:hypothetical protein